MSNQEKIANSFIKNLKDKPDTFTESNEGFLVQLATGVFYDCDNGALGSFYDEESDFKDESGEKEIIRKSKLYSMPVDSIIEIHKAYLEWVGWQNNNQLEELLGVVSEQEV